MMNRKMFVVLDIALITLQGKRHRRDEARAPRGHPHQVT